MISVYRYGNVEKSADWGSTPGLGGHRKVYKVEYDLAPAEVLVRLEKAVREGLAGFVVEDLTRPLTETQLFALFGESVRSRMTRSEDPRDRARGVGRPSSGDELATATADLAREGRRRDATPEGWVDPALEAALAKARVGYAPGEDPDETDEDEGTGEGPGGMLVSRRKQGRGKAGEDDYTPEEHRRVRGGTEIKSCLRCGRPAYADRPCPHCGYEFPEARQ